MAVCFAVKWNRAILNDDADVLAVRSPDTEVDAAVDDLRADWALSCLSCHYADRDCKQRALLFRAKRFGVRRRQPPL